jgi:hypothetical protein
MITTSEQTVAEYEQHQLDMLVWQADVHERNGRNQEASKIKEWVSHFVARQERNGTRLV